MTPHNPEPTRPVLTSFVRRMFAPVDIASLAFFRIFLGLVFVWECWRYATKNWIHTFYIAPEYLFHYEGFSWIKPWSGDGMYIHFGLMALFAFFMAIGFLYRLSALAHFFLFTFVYLLDQARYLNHFYLACLLNFLMILAPANRALSVDAVLFPWLRRKLGWKGWSPKIPSDTVPEWAVWILRTQMGLVYFYAAVAKMNADWLVHGEPIGDWLADRADYTLLGDAIPIGDWVFTEPWAGLVFAWGGFLLDLLAWPLLTWRKTRIPMFLGLLFFHTMNSWLFNIGIFPVMAVAATTIFFEPGWPRTIFRLPFDEAAWVAAKNAGVGALNATQRALTAGLAVYFAVQVLVPLRHFVYPGVVHWNEEGHRFAWHMKLRDKSGRATFFIHHPKTGISWEMTRNRTRRSDGQRVHPRIRQGQRDLLTRRQIRKMSTRPLLLHQFVQHLAGVMAEIGYDNVEIRVDNQCRLNLRPWQRLIEPSVDLTKVKETIAPSPWIVPLTTPFTPRTQNP